MCYYGLIDCDEKMAQMLIKEILYSDDTSTAKYYDRMGVLVVQGKVGLHRAIELAAYNGLNYQVEWDVDDTKV